MDSDNQTVLRYGFLGKDDFTIEGKFIKKKYPDTRRIQIQADEKNAPELFDVSFAVQKNDNIEKFTPEGFFVYSTVRCRVIAAIVVPAEIGFDYKAEIPFVGFACNGGVIDFTNKSFDFSGSSMVFPVQSNNKQSMPEFRVLLSDTPDGKFEYEAAHGTVTRHYYRYLKGEETSTNPMATIYAWSGAMRKRGELDALPDLISFADKLEAACMDTLNAGIMTKDLVSLVTPGTDARAVNSETFLDEIAARLSARLAS